jgi:hypothetical protein
MRTLPAFVARGAAAFAAMRPDTSRSLIVGRVLDVDTREPVSGAALWVRSVTGVSPVDIVRTSPGGEFVIRGLPSGRWFIGVSKSGFLHLAAAGGEQVILPEGERVTDLVLGVTRNAAITGTVTNERGDPLAGLRVALLDHTRRHAQIATTDDRGVYRFSTLRPGEYAVSVPSSVDAESATRTIALASGQEQSGVDFRVARARPLPSAPHGAVITGRVTDERGNPLAATVQALTRNAVTGDLVPANAARPTPAHSDEHGVYRIYGLPPGKYYVGVTHGMVGAGTAGHETTEADVQQARAGGAGPVGQGPLTVYAPMFHPGATALAEALPIEVGDGEARAGADVTVRLVRSVSLAGSVIAPDGSTPEALLVALTPDRPYIPAGQIVSSAGSGTAWSLGGLVTPPVTSSGRFTIRSLTPGPYTLVAHGRTRAPAGAAGADGGTPRLRARLTITLADHDLTDLVVTLQEAGLASTGRGGT